MERTQYGIWTRCTEKGQNVAWNGDRTHKVMTEVSQEKAKHMYPHFSLSWAEIEVQTSLKPLLDKVWISRHLTKTAIPEVKKGDEVGERKRRERQRREPKKGKEGERRKEGEKGNGGGRRKEGGRTERGRKEDKKGINGFQL